MAVEQVNSYAELTEKIKNIRNAYLLLYKEGSDQSECAKRNIVEVASSNKDAKIFLANVAEVRDIHPEYSITSVPSMLEFEKGNFKNTIKGCHQKDFYQNLLDHIIFEAKAAERPQKRVTVYTTPSCPWCTTVKNYLRKNGVRYSEVDVASDQNAAQNMVSKSGQQGVPQTEVDGKMVIGFDQTKLNQLLEITN
ncbi:glutaredoxin domain-containing protein [Bacteroidota bacterium]